MYSTELKYPWWRTTPIATNAQHHGARGADTHVRVAPTTGEDE